jgi:hypothetical protein
MFESERGEQVNLGRRLFLTGVVAAAGGAVLLWRRPHVIEGEDRAGGSDDCAILR